MTRSDAIESVTIGIVEHSMDNVFDCNSAHAVPRHLGVSDSRGSNVNILHFYAYKIRFSVHRQGEATDICIDISG